MKLNIFSRVISKISILYTRRKRQKFGEDNSILDIKNKFNDLNVEYEYYYHFYWNYLDKDLRLHREFFQKNQRGFGEDAFHAMWFLIFKEFKPINVLEIGVYRGQTLSLFTLLGLKYSKVLNVNGISPLTSAGDEVSTYLKNLDYENDINENFEYFNLGKPLIHKGFSTDIEMRNIILKSEWDLIYIDGNHDYEIAKSDFILCSESCKKGGIIVLDDSSLYTNYMPSAYSTAGHPGPSLVADEIDMTKFKEIISVGHNRVFIKL